MDLHIKVLLLNRKFPPRIYKGLNNISTINLQFHVICEFILTLITFNNSDKPLYIENKELYFKKWISFLSLNITPHSDFRYSVFF